VKPSVVVDHSSGEIAAAFCSGILSLENAMRAAISFSFLSFLHVIYLVWIDAILNFLSGEYLHQSTSVLVPLGRLLELGKTFDTGKLGISALYNKFLI
jgi:hypothetical protein